MAEVGIEEAEARAAIFQGSKIFICRTCDMEFTSFQALGGHRASCRKSKHKQDDKLGRSPSKPKTFKCHRCGMEFSSGQALGGHMGKHRARKPENKSNDNVILSTAASSGTTTDGRTVSTDLVLATREVLPLPRDERKKPSCRVFGVDLRLA